MDEPIPLNTTHKHRRLFFVALGIWLLFSLLIRLYFLDNLRWTYDEGIHVLLAQLLHRGFIPYQEVFISYPPLYTLSIDLTWRVFERVEALQVLMVLYTLSGILAVGLLGWRLGGIWAGLIAAIVLSLDPEFFRGSRGVLTEVPSLCTGALAITLAAYYLWSSPADKGRKWLIGSGLALSVSLMLKILTPYILGVIPPMILVRNWQLSLPKPYRDRYFWRRSVLDLGIWTAALILPIIGLTLLFDIPSFLDQVIFFRFASRIAYEGEINNLEFVLSFFRDNWVLSLLALFGSWGLIRYRFKMGWFILLWLFMAFIFAMLQVPLREKHLPLLLLPLSVLSGLGFASLIELGRFHARYQRWLSIILLVGLSLIYLWQTGQVLASYNDYQLTYLNDSDQSLAAFIDTYTSPDDCLITDDPTLAFVAERPVPPSLAEASSARLRSGYLNAAMLIDITSQHDCPLVAPTARRFKRSAPEFVEWAKDHYLGLWLYDGETEVLLAKPLVKPQAQYEVDAQFGKALKLFAYDLSPINEGQAYLSLYWQALKDVDKDYTVFVHIRDAQNNTLYNADHQPYNGLVGTSHWPPDSAIKESIRLDIGQNLPPGTYSIYVGLYHYDGSNFHRLPLSGDQSGENALIISDFVVP